jgi:hypothetical protein
MGMLIGFGAIGTFSRTSIEPSSQKWPGWKTNFNKRSVDLNEIKRGGPPKDGIPAIDAPKFVAPEKAESWLAPNEPVVALQVSGEAKAYPLQILIWHEIVNDEIGGAPVAATFCPLCHTAIVFDRRLDGRTYDFGVSGMLRHSDMIMYDRQTESWWQQAIGEAIVGDLTGKRLKQLPSQIASFKDFRTAFPEGLVLSRDTGHQRRYGQNPYVGYDDINSSPFLYDGPKDGRLRPMERLLVVTLDGTSKAYPYSVTSERRVIHDRIGHQEVVIFHAPGTVSALDRADIAASRDVGATGVFRSHVDGRRLTFDYQDGRFLDRETRSVWNILGHCLDGELRGRRLEAIGHGDYFAFAWLVFQPETEIYHP